MSFGTFRFKDIVNQSWEDSYFYDLLKRTTFMFVIFQKVDKSDSKSIFKGVYFWSMPEDDIDACKEYWDKLISVLKGGLKLEVVKGTVKNNFPKKKDSPIIHIRPHASQSAYRLPDFTKGKLSDADELPDGRFITRQCFWINASYIINVIKKALNQMK